MPSIYYLLFSSILLLWVPSVKGFNFWKLILLIFLVVGFLFNFIDIVALGSIIILYTLLLLYKREWRNYFVRFLLFTLIIFLAGALQSHIIPGFNNYLALKSVQISEHGIPYTLYFNIDKSIVGLLILGVTHQTIRNMRSWKNALTSIMKLFIPSSLILIGLSNILGFVNFDPKFPELIYLWAPVNLLLVCVAEEALFRGMIQRELSNIRKFSGSCSWAIAPIILASLIFGLAHFPGGWKYVLLSTVAGFCYGWAYYKTDRIEVSIILHFLVNLTHFLFFTYPALHSLA